jgi:hypothetical protein
MHVTSVIVRLPLYGTGFILFMVLRVCLALAFIPCRSHQVVWLRLSVVFSLGFADLLMAHL